MQPAGTDPDQVLAFGNGDALVVVNLGDTRRGCQGGTVVLSEGVTDGNDGDEVARDAAAWILVGGGGRLIDNWFPAMKPSACGRLSSGCLRRT